MKNLLSIILAVIVVISFSVITCRQQQKTVVSETLPKTSQPSTTVPTATQTNPQVPQKIYDVLKYIKENNRAPEGYVGGRHFGNFEGHLANMDANGRRINYQEWDVNAHLEHKNRGTERIITGSDGKAYYTNNHYQSFIQIQ